MAEFVLRGGDLMVMLVAGQAHFEHGGDHFAAQIDGAVDWGDREVAALDARAVAHVATFVNLAGIARQFDVVEMVEAFAIAEAEADIVENEEFSFGADVDGVTDAGRLEIGFAALGGRARVAAVKLARRGFDDIADQDQHRGRRERIDIGGIEIGHEDHVALIDCLPAFDRRAIEHEAVGQHVFIDDAGDHRQMLPLALGIGETQIDPFDVLFLDHIEDGGGFLAHVETCLLVQVAG